MLRMILAAASAALLVVLSTQLALGQIGLVSQYHHAGTRQLPPDLLGLGRVHDSLPDGRLLVAVGLSIHVEAAAGSGNYASLGVLPGVPPTFGPAFLRVSPDGSLFALGDNGSGVGVFSTTTLAGAWFAAFHFDAAWRDATHLAITDFGRVTILDVTSVDPTQPSNPTVINGIGGASGGIAFDAAGRLFTANGFAIAGPSATGDVRAFDPSAIDAVLAGAQPIDFESSGALVGNLLSGSPLGFDAAGRLFAGGGDFFGVGSIDFTAVVAPTALASALSGGSPISGNDPAAVLMLDPDPAPQSAYGVILDRLTGALLLSSFGADQLDVFAPAALPGTAEDFTLAVGVDAAASEFPDQGIATSPGQTVTFELASPMGTVDGGLALLAADVFVAGNEPMTPFVSFGVHVSPSALLFFLPTTLGPGAETFSFAALPLAAGFVVRVQGIAFAAQASNGFIAATNAFEFAF